MLGVAGLWFIRQRRFCTETAEWISCGKDSLPYGLSLSWQFGGSSRQLKVKDVVLPGAHTHSLAPPRAPQARSRFSGCAAVFVVDWEPARRECLELNKHSKYTARDQTAS